MQLLVTVRHKLHLVIHSTRHYHNHCKWNSDHYGTLVIIAYICFVSDKHWIFYDDHLYYAASPEEKQVVQESTEVLNMT